MGIAAEAQPRRRPHATTTFRTSTATQGGAAAPATASVKGTYGLTSSTGLPSTMSVPPSTSVRPSTAMTRATERPMGQGLGRGGRAGRFGWWVGGKGCKLEGSS